MTDDHNTKDTNNEDGISRRRFIKNTGMVAGGVVGGSLLGSLLTNQLQTKPKTETKTKQGVESTFQEARMFFSRWEDFAVLQMATERIYPKDDNGPGAIELGVPYFIDKQLAGPWGINAKDYRKGPFFDYDNVENSQNKEEESIPPNPQGAQGQDKKTETENQRNQSRLNRGEIFLQGLRKMNQISNDNYKESFDKTSEENQVAILQDFADGKVKMTGVASENFFTLLRQATLEGAYSDPLYGGNKNMQGWKMKEFPGAQPSYANIIEKDEFAKMEPISLRDYQKH